MAAVMTTAMMMGLRVAPLKVGLKVVMRLMAVLLMSDLLGRLMAVLRKAATLLTLSMNLWAGGHLVAKKTQAKQASAFLQAFPLTRRMLSTL
jgi:hypothetical protein